MKPIRSFFALAAIYGLLLSGFFGDAQLNEAQAAIYKHTNPDGSVEFSDIPTDEHAKIITLPPGNSIPAPPRPPPRTTRKAKSSANADSGEAEQYTTLAITQPADNNALRSNAGNVTINVKLTPALQGGHVLIIQMDGKTVAKGRETTTTLNSVDRGTHSLQAQVVDKKGKVLIRAKSTTFHLLRTSVLLNRSRNTNSATAPPFFTPLQPYPPRPLGLGFNTSP
ncbi:MAG: DUF4124 domain-containing protein [Gammaproteobacteria bacterium]|nr:DUF4124 domain-containing protein [Gammaproteobacteria bacterium]